MDRRTNQTLLLVILILVPLALILGACLILTMNRPGRISVPDVAFLEETEAEATLTTSIVIPAQSRQLPVPSRQQTSEHTITAPRTLDRLTGDRLMFCGYPECVVYNFYGEEIGRLQLEEPDAADLAAAGLEEKLIEFIVPAKLNAIAATE